MKNISILLIAVVLLFSCGKKESTTKQDKNNTVSTNTDNKPNNSNTSSNAITIKDGEWSATITASTTSSIQMGTEQFYTKVGSSGKLKYMKGEECIAKIKKSDDGFKLKREDGNLLWKIKTTDGNIKIASNEEMQNAFKIKKKSKIKIYKDDVEVKEIPIGSSIPTADGKNFTIGNCDTQKAAVLALTDIPLELRLIIITELNK